MQFSQDKQTQPFVFHRADENGVLVNETLHTKSFMITVEPVLLDWPVTQISELNTPLLEQLVTGAPDVILIGTGAKPAHLPHALLAFCWEKRIGLEAMTTPAAAKTYNVLANEGRRVAIGLILPPCIPTSSKVTA